MGERRKVFRIEATAALGLDPQIEHPQLPQLAEILQELSALRATLAATPARSLAKADASPHDEIARLTSELHFVRSAIGGPHEADAGRDTSRSAAALTARIPDELEAVLVCSEQATQKILAAAEDIDQAANTLSAALKDGVEQGLAQDIRDRVIHIFEACNYQDLTGQRVTKVMTALSRIERQIAGALNEAAHADTTPTLRGPRLANDRGHVSQSDVDSMFAADAPSAAAAVREIADR